MVGDVHGVSGGRAGEGGVDFIGGFSAACGAATDDGDLGSLGGEGAGDFLTDSASSSGDDGDFIGKA